MNDKDKWIPPEKCNDCFTLSYDEEIGHYCPATLCVKEYDYDPETRTWTPIPPYSKNTLTDIAKDCEKVREKHTHCRICMELLNKKEYIWCSKCSNNIS